MRTIRNEIKVNNTPQDDLINQIIDIEWDMFGEVNSLGQRASCQDDEWTFYVMRYSQFNAYTVGMLSLYMNDLNVARKEKRNLLTEKYGYMMEYTHKDYFEANLKPYLPPVSPAKAELAEKTADILVEAQMELAIVYPNIVAAGRPSSGVGDSLVSLQIYTIGELKTYSEDTLKVLHKNLVNMIQHGVNPARQILLKTVELYGYGSLEEAEIKMKKKQEE